MKKILKRFAAWVTGLQSNIFIWARISFTVLYLLIILVVLSVYSVAMYFSLLKNLQDQFNLLSNTPTHYILIDHVIDALQVQIVLIDIGTFIVAAIGSYWLAGVTLRPVKRALEAQATFSADASHELRTPLAVMKTDIEVLLRGKTSLAPEVVNVLKSNLEEINLLSKMTAELLELSRGKHATHEELMVNTIASEEVQKLQSLARQKDIALSYEGSSASAIIGDHHAIARVIKNVVANAIAYTPAGGTVMVTVQEQSNNIIVSVRDTGVGIHKKDLPHIFNRFYKTDTARKENDTGSGLGLAIAKQIVERYRGTIAIHSTIQEGTTVIITLPHQ